MGRDGVDVGRRDGGREADLELAEEIAGRLGISRRRVYKMIEQPQAPVFRELAGKGIEQVIEMLARLLRDLDGDGPGECRDLLDAVQRILSRVRGSLYLAVMFVATIFAFATLPFTFQPNTDEDTVQIAGDCRDMAAAYMLADVVAGDDGPGRSATTDAAASAPAPARRAPPRARTARSPTPTRRPAALPASCAPPVTDVPTLARSTRQG